MIVVTFVGLKKCGKTTTIEAVVKELKSRGLAVGTIKYMPHSSFTVDIEGKDTWRHKEAGADFVISQSADELAFIRRTPERPPLSELLALVPEGTDVLLCEGLEDPGDGGLTVVLAKEPGLLQETFEVRQPKGTIIALSGIMSNEIRLHPDNPELPVLSAVVDIDVQRMANLILNS